MKNPLNFLVMGDWGGSPNAPYTTDREIQTAAGLDSVSAALNASFVLALGDNFYDAGIPSDENDPRFQSTFENVYNGTSLQGKDFFRILAGKGSTSAGLDELVAMP